MSQYWERLFVAVARLCGWAVAVVPIIALLIFIAAFIYARRSTAAFEFVPGVISQTAVTIFLAAIATAAGATIGIGGAIFSHERTRGKFGRIIRLHAKFLAVVPAVVIGWFGVTILLPESHAAQPGWVLAAVAAAIAITVLPDAYILTVRAVRALPGELLEAAAALGANATQATSQVILPGSISRLIGIYAAIFSRALPEATAASIIIFAAAGAGYPLSHFSLSAVLLAQSTSLRVIDPSMPLIAVLLLGLSVTARVVAARRIGELEWI